jgi:hypothetical protein
MTIYAYICTDDGSFNQNMSARLKNKQGKKLHKTNDGLYY